MLFFLSSFYFTFTIFDVFSTPYYLSAISNVLKVNKEVLSLRAFLNLLFDYQVLGSLI